jgi:hypothetical protein
MPKKWVVNASPLIVLARINHLFLLQHLATELVVPTGVAMEITQGPANDPANQWLQSHGRELVREVQVIPPVIIAWNLGLGESEVLAWAYDRGRPESDSDLDVAVLVQDRTPQLEEALLEAAYQVMWDHDCTLLISLKVFDAVSFATYQEKGSPSIRKWPKKTSS